MKNGPSVVCEPTILCTQHSLWQKEKKMQMEKAHKCGKIIHCRQKKSGIKKEIQRTIKSFVLFMWCTHAAARVRLWMESPLSEYFRMQRERASSVKSQMEIISSSIYWVLCEWNVRIKMHIIRIEMEILFRQIIIYSKPGQTFLDWMCPNMCRRKQSASFSLTAIKNGIHDEWWINEF